MTSLSSIVYMFTGPDLLHAGPLFRKKVGPLIYAYPVKVYDASVPHKIVSFVP